jgi:beta-lactamase class A
LKSRWKSLPSGVLQNWPSGTPITIATYASDMISMSDNTAADSLASIVGERAVAPYAAGNVPMLTTRELFVLRAAANAGLAKRWITATPAGRRELRTQIATMPLPSADSIGSNPGDLRAEWRFSTDQLCRLMAGVAALPLMSINPGLADPRAFRRIAYKGGSEPGVLSMVTSVKTLAGRNVCVAATINDPQHPIDQNAFELDYAAMLAAVSTM